MDTLSPKERSERMSQVRGKNTKPELVVRRLVYSLGFRYRLHVSDLPGKPDLAFRKRKKAIFVHGCFWHRHDEICPLTRLPKTKIKFWETKFAENEERDRRNQAKLKIMGWQFLIIWECELKNIEVLSKRIKKFLEK